LTEGIAEAQKNVRPAVAKGLGALPVGVEVALLPVCVLFSFAQPARRARVLLVIAERRS
jgi:hypothetical protein